MTATDKRLERGAVLADCAHIEWGQDGSVFVESESRPGSFYRIAKGVSGNIECSCPDFERRGGLCKHGAAVATRWQMEHPAA